MQDVIFSEDIVGRWLLNRLFNVQDQPTPRFAFQGTVNWIHALSVLVDTEVFDDASIKAHYKNLQRRKVNKTADTAVFENVLMAFHNISSLSEINSSLKNKYDVIRSQIISWYYAIYYSGSAMVTASSGATPDTHASTAKVFQKEIVENKLIVQPFDLHLPTLIEKDVKKIVSELRDGNKYDLNTKASNEEEAWGGVYSYLSGTADYKKWEIEERVKSGKKFKELGVTNFRTKKARALRDEELSKGMVNFLVQAFRYRGKANYRDSIYLSYGDDRGEEIAKFSRDLENVSKAFSTNGMFLLGEKS